MNANIKVNFESGVAVNDDNASNEFKGWGYRHQQSLILFFAITISYSIRAFMGVAVVAMTHQNQITNNVIQNLNTTYKLSNITEGTHLNITLNRTRFENPEEFHMNGFLNTLMLTPPYPQFNWSKKVQSTIISSFFCGYTIMQIPAGQLVHRFGARYLIAGAMFINCAISLIVPLVAYYGGWVCIAIFRLLQGLTQAFVVPGIHTFFGKWATLEERGRLTSSTYGGQALGIVLGFLVTGLIASSPMGWPGLFRIYALLSGIIGCLVWWMSADTPAEHPNISEAERKYIENGLGQKAGYEKRKLPVPWSRIFRHTGVNAFIVCQVGNTWGQIILYSEVPSYMDKVMGLNIKANGLLSSLPFMIMLVTNFFFSWFSDMLIVKKLMSVTNVRKLANSMGYVPCAIGLIVLAYVPKNIYVVESILVTICAFKISAHLGFQVNPIDIAPNFSGTVMSMGNFVSYAVSSLAPIVSGFILTDVTSQYLWRRVFFLTSGIYFFTNLVFVIFGTAEKADWNDPDYRDTDKEGQEENHPMLVANNIDKYTRKS